MRSRFWFVLVLCLVVILSACARQVATSLPGATARPFTNNPAYPAPESTHGTDYPAPTPLYGQTPAPLPEYPAPTLKPGSFVAVVAFKLDKPIIAGVTEVTGTGPANIPILLEDISFFGEILGQTIVREDGTFVFEVKPLEAEHRLGLTTGDLTNTKWSEANFEDPGFFGDEARLIPNVGFFYDTTNVVGK